MCERDGRRDDSSPSRPGRLDVDVESFDWIDVEMARPYQIIEHGSRPVRYLAAPLVVPTVQMAVGVAPHREDRPKGGGVGRPRRVCVCLS